MNSKKNQVLLGVIIVVLGLIALLRPDITGLFQFGSLLFLFAGLAFLLLYRTKRKSWSLIFGCYLTYFGTAILLSPVLGQQAVLTIVGAMFFIVPAVIFFVLYLNKNKKGLLMPACIMFWFGIYLFLRDFPLFERLNGFGLLFICIGVAFFTAYMLGKTFIGRWTLCLSFVFVTLGLFRIISFNPISALFGGFAQLSAVLLLIFGVIIIIKAVRKK